MLRGSEKGARDTRSIYLTPYKTEDARLKSRYEPLAIYFAEFPLPKTLKCAGGQVVLKTKRFSQMQAQHAGTPEHPAA